MTLARQLLPILLAGLATASKGPCATCKSSDLSTLDGLNQTVRGRVHVNKPFALPCFSSYEGEPIEYDSEACKTVQDNYASPTFRTGHPGAYMNYQDSMCISDPDDQCVLNNNDPSASLSASADDCRQGNVPSHYLEVTDVCDVRSAFQFAKQSGKQVVIKNSGHDYLSHSSQKGALALWTRNLQQLDFHKAFVPEGCPAEGSHTYRAITTGAGVNCGEAYDFADAHDSTVVCGYSETVGISGGWVQNGGHSVLSPVYGLGVDRVVEFKVVTPNGDYVAANACQHSDLFWALRGGGGGTFGVVMESTHMVEELVPVVVADVEFKSNTTTLLEFADILMEEAASWADAGWGGHISDSSLIYVNPKLSVEEAKKSFKKAADYAVAHGGKAEFKQFGSFYGFFQTYVAPNSVTVGNTHIAGSRLVPRDVLESASGRQNLRDFIKNLVSSGGKLYVPVAMPTGGYQRENTNSTSVTPAWYSSLWQVGAGTGWAWNSSLETRQSAIKRLNNLTAQLEDATPNGGAYMNEANPFTSDWQQAWWGSENYAALSAIKERYDPDGLLKCWRCVGWEESDVSSSCFSAFNDL